MVPALAQFLDTMHTMTGAPWWAVITGAVVTVRAVALPLTFRAMAAGSRLKSIMPFLQLYRKQNMDTVRHQDQGAIAATTQKLRELNNRYQTGFTTLMAPPLFQLVFGIWIFTTLRRMGLEADQIAGFATEGLPWVPDLGGSEFTLPLGMLVMTLVSTELSKVTHPKVRTPGALRPEVMVQFGRVMAVVGAGVMTIVPSVSERRFRLEGAEW
jgi:membrane protein insertase Oxa1/YidC/SpoIIIJ